MFGMDITLIVGAIGAIATGIFAFLFKMKDAEASNLRVENNDLVHTAETAKAQTKIAENRARLHREAAKTVLKNSNIAEDKSRAVEKMIEEAEDGEMVTVTT